MANKPNKILVGDTMWTMTAAYRDGAKAMRADVTFHANPHRQGSSSHAEWDAGHENESCNEHERFGLDLIEQHNQDLVFDEDPQMQRNEWGEAVRRQDEMETIP